MNNPIICVIACLLAVCAAGAADGQSPAPSPSTVQGAATQQPLSKQIATDCWNKRRLAIRAVNLKYIALTQDASNAFLKENNQARVDDANTWIKNLAWANDANLKGVAPDAPDRLGVLQAAYLKERVNAIVTADNACVDDVESASKKAAQGGDQASVTELAKLEDRIKQELRNVNKSAVPAVAAAPRKPEVAAANPGPAQAPAATASPQPGNQSPAGNPFGVTADKLQPGFVSPQ